MADTTSTRSGYHTEFSSLIGSLASAVSLHVRKKMFKKFTEFFPDPLSVLDLGVTSESVAPEANYFEELFADKSRITAAGLEDAGYLEKRFPGLKFVRVSGDAGLPFVDRQFQVAFSNAVIEHVVDPDARVRFLAELARVSDAIFLTTPNLFFPIEPHTGMPFLHFLAPSLFYRLIDRGVFSRFYSSRNLRLLRKSDLLMLAENLGMPYKIVPVRFAGFISNWILVAWHRQPDEDSKRS